MGENEDISLVIETESEKAEKGVSKLKQKLEELKNGLTKAAQGAKQMGIAFGTAYSAISIGTITHAINMTKHYAKEIYNLAEKAGRYQQTMKNFNQTFSVDASTLQKASKFADTMVEKFGLVEEQVKSTQTAMYNMLTALDGLQTHEAEMLSENLTEMAVDYAAKFNLSIEQATQKFKSAMAGETEAIRKEAGFDITDTTIQTKALELGIGRTAGQLNQLEKRLLRVIVLQEQFERSGTRGAYANSLNNANVQLTIMKSQITEIITWTGNLIVQVFGNAFVYINGFLMAIKAILKSFASMAGYTLEMPSIGDSLNIGGTNDALDKTNEKLKKAKDAVTGIDELNIISQDTGSAGLGTPSVGGVDPKILNALKEYENMMDKVDNKALEIRDKIMEFLGFEPTIDGEWKLGEGWNNFTWVLPIIEGIAALLLGKIITAILIGMGKNGIKASRVGAGIGLAIVFGISFALTVKDIIKDKSMDGSQLFNLIISTIALALAGFLITGSAAVGGLVLGIGLLVSFGLATVFGDDKLLEKFDWLLYIIGAIGLALTTWHVTGLLMGLGKAITKFGFIAQFIKVGTSYLAIGAGIVLIIAGLAVTIIGFLQVIRGEEDGVYTALAGILLLAIGVGLAFGLIPALIVALIAVLGLAFTFFASNWDLIVVGFWELVTKAEVAIVTLVGEIVRRFKSGFTNIAASVFTVVNHIQGFIDKVVTAIATSLQYGLTSAFYATQIVGLSVFAALATAAQSVVNLFLGGMKTVAGLVDNVAGTDFSSNINTVTWGDDAWAKVEAVKTERDEALNGILNSAANKFVEIDNKTKTDNELLELGRQLKNIDYLETYESKVAAVQANREATMAQKVADYQQKQAEKEAEKAAKEAEKSESDGVLNQLQSLLGMNQEKTDDQLEEQQKTNVNLDKLNTTNEQSNLENSEFNTNNLAGLENLNLSTLGVNDAITSTHEESTSLLSSILARIGDVVNACNNIRINVTNNYTTQASTGSFATGGFPKVGSLFMAREAGPELVGKFGNQTGVVNNEQIIEGVSNGVYQAVVAAMSNNKSKTVIQIDGKTILTATEKASRNRGSNVMGGAFANA